MSRPDPAGTELFDRQAVLEGERILLRPYRPEDYEVLYAVASDPLDLGSASGA